MILLSSYKPVIMVNSQLSTWLEKQHRKQSHTRSSKTLSPQAFDAYCVIFKQLICLFNCLADHLVSGFIASSRAG